MWCDGEGNVSFAPVAAPTRNDVQHKISLVDLLLKTKFWFLTQGQVTWLSMRRSNSLARQHTDWFRQWMKKESSGSYWKDLVNFLLPWWLFTKSLQGFSAIISWAAENTHSRDEETQRCAMPSASLVTEEMLQWPGTGRKWMLLGDLPALVSACNRPDRQPEEDTSCVEMDIAAMVCPALPGLGERWRSIGTCQGGESGLWDVRLRWYDSVQLEMGQ